MVARSLGGDEESFADIAVGEAFGDEAQDLGLSSRQAQLACVGLPYAGPLRQPVRLGAAHWNEPRPTGQRLDLARQRLGAKPPGGGHSRDQEIPRRLAIASSDDVGLSESPAAEAAS